MINRVLEGIFGTKDYREIKKMSKVIETINNLEASYSKLSDDEIKAKTPEFRDRLSKGETLDDILPEAFATVREASKRTLGLRHFDVQLIGGIVLHQGKVAEMKTGEGKTLSSTCPVYLNALTGRGVHIVTVNNYLAKRDREWMKPIYDFLGLTVGLVIGRPLENKAREYACDVVYATNNELGFDYLRGNMSQNSEDIYQKNHNFVIIDEVDSILLDEARTPLIISGSAKELLDIYDKFASLVRKLKIDVDYTVEKKDNMVLLSPEGITHVEKELGIDNLYSPDNIELTHYLNQALKAKELFTKDRDYIVQDKKVVIVDEFTGRLMPGRRYSEGLHQSIEAKENVPIANENKTLATITLQNYFRLYSKMSGMTGTAKTDESELVHIYNLSVVSIPTNKPVIRKDYNDIVFLTKEYKIKAIVDKIKEIHSTGQPILVGTASICSSEELSYILKKNKIKHDVLNAKNHEREAEIVAQAGRLGAVTIATNMAGRGTDIALGGNYDFIAKRELSEDDENYAEKYQKCMEDCGIEKQKVLELGGLFILGSERHENRRIDNQLRGRAGRQGDPGASLFYLSLEDDLMKIFGSDRMIGLMKKMGYKEEEPIEHSMVTKSIEGAQKRIEARNFASRKQLLEYDDVINKQREVIYKQRQEILSCQNIDEKIYSTVKRFVREAISILTQRNNEVDEERLRGYFKEMIGVELSNISFDEETITAHIIEMIEKNLEDIENSRSVKMRTMINVIDSRWRENIGDLDSLREGIHLRSYGQRDPIVEYRIAASRLYYSMTAEIRKDIISYLLKVNLD